MVIQVVSHVSRVLHLRGHAHLERLERTHQQPPRPRIRRGADKGPQRADPLHDVPASHTRPRYHIAVAADELGGRVEHQVGTVLQGMLEERPQKRIVHHHHGALIALGQ
jgi:hypothetical protein